MSIIHKSEGAALSTHGRYEGGIVYWCPTCDSKMTSDTHCPSCGNRETVEDEHVEIRPAPQVEPIEAQNC